MRFREVLEHCKGQQVVINNNEERTLVDVGEDFLVLGGGNPQMRITDFVPMIHVVKVIKADYTATNTTSISLDLSYSAGESRRSGA